MDFEALVGHDDAFDEEPQNCLARFEIGASKAGTERAGDILRSKRAAVCHLCFEALRFEIAQLLFRREARLVDDGNPFSKQVQGEGTELVGIRQALPLLSQVVESCRRSGKPDSGFRIGEGRSLDPRADLLGKRFGILEQILHGGPDGLIHALDMQSLVDAASAYGIRERRQAHTADIVGVTIVAALPASLDA